MKNLDRKVTLFCPLCGNNQFEFLDEKFEDLGGLEIEKTGFIYMLV